MFNKNIDVAEIMVEIQQKAKLKRVMGSKKRAMKSYNALRDELDFMYMRISDLSDEIIKRHKYTKEHENTAQKLPVNRQQFVLLRKAVTFTKKVVKKLTKFIWVEQNEVNKSLNENIKMLYQVQMEMTKSFAVFNGILSSLENIDTRIKHIEKIITNSDEGKE